MDPLSDMLSLLKVRSYMSGGFDAGRDWSIQFDRREGIKFYAVISGECWLSVDDVSDPVRVRSGDCFLLPRGRGFRDRERHVANAARRGHILFDGAERTHQSIQRRRSLPQRLRTFRACGR